MLLLHHRIWSLHDSTVKDHISNLVEEMLDGPYLVIHTGRYCTLGSKESKDEAL